MSNPTDPHWQAIFKRRIAAYKIDPMEEQSVREMVTLLMYQRTRPARPSDTLSGAFSALSFIEEIYARIARDTDADFLLSVGGEFRDILYHDISGGALGGAETSPHRDHRGGAGS